MATVYYTDIQKGQDGTKKIVSFSNQNVFDVVATAKEDELYDVTLEKGEKYWEWTAINKSGSAQPVVSGPKSPTASPRSTYETPEERARKQVFIVRQSSISNAVATLSTGSKVALDPSDVVKVAQYYEQYVFDLNAEDDIQDSSLYDGDEPQ